MQPERILVVEDDTSIRRILRLQLEAAGYEVAEAEDGLKAMEWLERSTPDLILLDVMMPNLDGNETCRRIRENRRFASLPIIFLTAKSTTESKILGLHGGANDYLTKPYDRKELLLRVKNLLGWSRQQRDCNPLTGLPGNPAIEAKLQSYLDSGSPFAFLYLDLDNFKAYNDFYSYRAGDDVIRLLAETLSDTVEQQGEGGDFVGHVGGDDFVAIVDPRNADRIAAAVVERFDAKVPELYQTREREAGYVEIENRRGETERFSLVSVTIALVESEQYRIEHVAMLNDVVADLKRHGKSRAGSVVVRDRRQEPPAEVLRTGSDG